MSWRLTVTRPGVYRGMPAETYHGDCCDAPSLSASGAKLLMDECPAAFWHASTMNPDFVPERKREFDIGTAAHLVFLEPDLFGERVVVIDAADYRTKAARDARDDAYAAGKTPLLTEQARQVQAMRNALFAHPIARKAFSGGEAELSMFWRDQTFGVWLKTRPDYLPAHGRWVVDYKTAASANPRAFAKRAYDLGYFQQAAWYLDGVEATTGRRPEHFWFVVQQKDLPHLVTVCQLDEAAIEWGRLLNRKAVEVFARCLERGEWPGYRQPDAPHVDKAFIIGLPGYAHFQLQDRDDAGEFKPTPEMLSLATRAQAPHHLIRSL